jgi:DNA-directed RNA polymerase sigma subunit (sigma70/sigma32)
MLIDEDENFTEYFILAQEDALSPRQSHIIELRYGFANGEHHTLQQIGHEFGLSRERIRQILQ